MKPALAAGVCFHQYSDLSRIGLDYTVSAVPSAVRDVGLRTRTDGTLSDFVDAASASAPNPMPRRRSETRGIPPPTIPPMKKPRMVKESSTVLEDSSRVAREAKALVALAFRNGPIENLHAGKTCPQCHGKAEYSHITQREMRQIMKAAVDQVYTFLVLKKQDGKAYQALLSLGERYTTAWDEPVLTKNL